VKRYRQLGGSPRQRSRFISSANAARPPIPEAYLLRQLLANAAIAASRVLVIQ